MRREGVWALIAKVFDNYDMWDRPGEGKLDSRHNKDNVNWLWCGGRAVNLCSEDYRIVFCSGYPCVEVSVDKPHIAPVWRENSLTPFVWT